FATVYNTLQLLRDMGQVRELIVDELRRRYDANTDAHHHAVCRRCHAIVDVEPEEAREALQSLARARLGRSGFSVETVAVEWTGLCRDCAQSG
ncbi:MAG TPA: transcriptional repressor, partial [Armatimonadota bacterium]|nr:transcriptional repressor [Armatimonadota bacterium]